MSRPCDSDGTVANNHCVYVVGDGTTCSPNGLLIVVTGTLGPAARGRMPVVEIGLRDHLVEFLRASLAVCREIGPFRLLLRHPFPSSPVARHWEDRCCQSPGAVAEAVAQIACSEESDFAGEVTREPLGFMRRRGLPHYGVLHGGRDGRA